MAFCIFDMMHLVLQKYSVLFVITDLKEQHCSTNISNDNVEDPLVNNCKDEVAGDKSILADLKRSMDDKEKSDSEDSSMVICNNQGDYDVDDDDDDDDDGISELE